MNDIQGRLGRQARSECYLDLDAARRLWRGDGAEHSRVDNSGGDRLASKEDGVAQAQSERSDEEHLLVALKERW
jgi:hypothetical protein